MRRGYAMPIELMSLKSSTRLEPSAGAPSCAMASSGGTERCRPGPMIVAVRARAAGLENRTEAEAVQP